MFNKSIPNVDLVNQLESVIRKFVKKKLELFMREEMKNFLEIKQKRLGSTKSKYAIWSKGRSFSP